MNGMHFQSSSQSWLRDFLPGLFALILSSAEELEVPCGTLENEITLKLAARIQANLASSEEPFPFQVKCNVRDVTPDGGIAGDHDLEFVPVRIPHHISDITHLYLVVECKRLRFPSKSGPRAGASLYVKEGLIRFCCGQYARAVFDGALLGYVMDGKITEAISAVRRAVDREKASVNAVGNPILRKSPWAETLPNALESKHLRTSTGACSPICIHHLFASMKSASSPVK